MLFPQLLSFMQDPLKIGRFMEAWCFWQGRQDAWILKILSTDDALFWAFQFRQQNVDHRQFLQPGLWRQYIRDELQISGYDFWNGAVWLIDEPTGWWEFQLFHQL